MARPSLLLMTAAASALAVVANAASIAAPDAQSVPKTRLGNSIEQDMSASDAAAARRKRGLDLREQAAKAAEARLQANLAARQQQEAAATQTAANGQAEAPEAIIVSPGLIHDVHVGAVPGPDRVEEFRRRDAPVPLEAAEQGEDRGDVRRESVALDVGVVDLAEHP